MSICFYASIILFQSFLFIYHLFYSTILFNSNDTMGWSTRYGRQMDNEVGSNGADEEEAGDGGVDEEEAVMRRACDYSKGGGMQRRGGGGGDGRWWQ